MSARLARSESCYEISFCETRKKRFSLRNFVTRHASRDSRYETSVCETREKWVSLLILTRESRENFARILGQKASLASRENFKKWFLCQPKLERVGVWEDCQTFPYFLDVRLIVYCNTVQELPLLFLIIYCNNRWKDSVCDPPFTLMFLSFSQAIGT
jgi:hypothetical protein